MHRNQELMLKSLHDAVASLPVQIFDIIFINVNMASTTMRRNVNVGTEWCNMFPYCAVSTWQMEINREREC